MKLGKQNDVLKDLELDGSLRYTLQQYVVNGKMVCNMKGRLSPHNTYRFWGAKSYFLEEKLRIFNPNH